jgi:CDP-glucose 4,6-dehydratase
MLFNKEKLKEYMFKNIYRGKRVLVTGHTGFKGSWLCIWLKELGAEVMGYALDPPSEPNNFSACLLSEHIDHQHGDVRDHDRLLSIVSHYEPEIVFHLAAQALVRPAYENPKVTFDTNAGGTVNVMEAVRQTDSIRVLVNITSDKCYENREWVWGYRENDSLGGHDPYSASKGCAELIFSAYLRSFFSNPASGGRQIGAGSCRAGNAIGGGDWGRDRLIPDCVRALSSGRSITIRNPHAIRPWQHVLEPLSGYLWLGTRLWEDPDGFSGAWNFGPAGADNGSVQDVVDRFIETWGCGAYEDLSGSHAVHEAFALRLCCDKAMAGLGWGNALTLPQTIVLTADWYRQYYQNSGKADMYDVCIGQIGYYVDQARSGKLSWTAAS